MNIYLDGSFAFGVSNMVALQLKPGQLLEEKDIQNILNKEEKEKAYQRAVLLLGYRPRSEKELVDRLKKAEFSSEAIDSTINILSEQKLVDDRQFAQSWVENRNDFRPRSKRALRYELMNKGIDCEIIEETLEEAVDDEILATKAAEKYLRKFRQGQPVDQNAFHQKLTGYLARLGFPYSIVKEVVKTAWFDYLQGSKEPS